MVNMAIHHLLRVADIKFRMRIWFLFDCVGWRDKSDPSHECLMYEASESLNLDFKQYWVLKHPNQAKVHKKQPERPVNCLFSGCLTHDAMKKQPLKHVCLHVRARYKTQRWWTFTSTLNKEWGVVSSQDWRMNTADMSDTVRGISVIKSGSWSPCASRCMRDPVRAESSSGVKWDKTPSSSPRHILSSFSQCGPRPHATVGHVCSCSRWRWLTMGFLTLTNIHTQIWFQSYNTKGGIHWLFTEEFHTQGNHILFLPFHLRRAS